MTDMTQPMSAAQAAQQNNRDTGGKYATKGHGEAGDVSLADAATAAAERAETAKDAWRAINAEVHAACLDAVRAEISAIYPNAKYVVFESSDQGDYAAISQILDATGEPALDRDGNTMGYDVIETADDYAGFMSFDSPHAWSDQHLVDDLPDSLAHQIARGRYVVDATPAEENPDVAGERADKARDQWHEANEAAHAAAVESMRAAVLAEEPDAAYIVVESSDQGDYGVLGSIYDASGRELIDEEEAEEIEGARAAADWLSVDNPHAWEQYIVETPAELDGKIRPDARVIATR